MIDVSFRPTGIGKKTTIMLEECGQAYNVLPVNINKGDQSTLGYGAIPQYLGEKSGRLLPEDTAGNLRDRDPKPPSADRPGL